jgi:uncharacterized protein
MALDAYLLSVIVDPVDHGPLRYIEADAVLVNERRGIVYAVHGAIPVLIASESREATAEEKQRWQL